MLPRGRRAAIAAGLLLATVVSAGGCQSGEATTPPPIAIEKPAAPQATGVAPPTRIEGTPISLYHRGEVAVGSTPEAAFKAFADLRSAGFEDTSLPPGFREPYSARSWEDGEQGFGVILYTGLVVAAMYQANKVPISVLYSTVRDYEARLSPTNITPRRVSGAKVNYWFWDYRDQRLMICGFRKGDDQVEMTECMGVSAVLDAIGISYDQAVNDAAKVDGAGPRFGSPSSPSPK